MKTGWVVGIALLLLAIYPLSAQHPGGPPRAGGGAPHEMPRANQGHIPEAPPHREPNARPEEEHHETGHVNSVPHVNHNHWYGHDAPNDGRYHVDHPYPHGRFEHFGPAFRYHVLRIDRDRHRFWFPGGYYFEVASWDWPLCADWCWDCGDDFIVYDDTDHPGWYLLYNIHTGVYVHVMYMGT